MADREHPLTVNLSGRAAIVTGAAGEIGRAIAAALNRSGASVALVDRDVGGLHLHMQQAGPRCIAVEADITDASQAAGGVKATVWMPLGVSTF